MKTSSEDICSEYDTFELSNDGEVIITNINKHT